jgi:hypothetical protein
MPRQPLAEVFGFPIDNMSGEAQRHRANRLCPFNNRVANCTKDKANDPLGVCSVLSESEAIITCPVRFRQRWLIAEHAARYFFPEGAHWTALNEVKLKDADGKSAGNIDIVMVAYDDRGKVADFGALEVQAVYISGNVREPFEYYMGEPQSRQQMDWSQEEKYPRVDYPSSSRKRLAPQLIFKGGIFRAWKKKTAVALNKGFFESLPELEEVRKEDSEVAWLIYDLALDRAENVYRLELIREVYTRFAESLQKITQSNPGDVNKFIETLQQKVTKKLRIPPTTEAPDVPF